MASSSTRAADHRPPLHDPDVDYGIVATRNGPARQHFFITDNVLTGPCTWPRTKGIENPRGIQVAGTGHVVCYNRIRGFADAIDTLHHPCAAIDFHNNEISECTDDGIEMDYREQNTRCFDNRLTNVFQGISAQPVFGGPVYIFRNAMYNIGMETFKLHNNPSGVLLCTTPRSRPACLDAADQRAGHQLRLAQQPLRGHDGQLRLRVHGPDARLRLRLRRVRRPVETLYEVQ